MTLEKDPQQEDFLQGRMLGNPYSSNEHGLGPLMRDVKNKICQGVHNLFYNCCEPFLGKTLKGVLPLCDDRHTPASLVQSEAVVYLENGLT